MLEQQEAVQRMQDYIDQNLYENISLTDLANVSLFSPWYSYRLLKQWTNYTPADYIRKLRLSKSALRLRNQEQKISDIAFETGFGSVDGYQRAFLKEFLVNPKEYALNPIPIQLFIPYGVKFRAVANKRKKNNKVKNIFNQVIDKKACKAIIKRGHKANDYFTYCNEVGCDVWGLLTSINSVRKEPVCLWLPDAYIKPNTSKYVQGVEVDCDYDQVIPEGYDIIDLPSTKYLMFQGEPFEEIDYATAITEVWDAIKKYDPTIIGYNWDDTNPRIQLEPIGTRGYIELVSIK